MSYQATLHIHPGGQRALQVATAKVDFLNRMMQFYDVTTPDGMCFAGPLEPEDVGRMLQCAFLVLLENGRKYRVASSETTDRWYVKEVSSR